MTSKCGDILVSLREPRAAPPCDEAAVDEETFEEDAGGDDCPEEDLGGSQQGDNTGGPKELLAQVLTSAEFDEAEGSLFEASRPAFAGLEHALRDGPNACVMEILERGERAAEAVVGGTHEQQATFTAYAEGVEAALVSQLEERGGPGTSERVFEWLSHQPRPTADAAEGDNDEEKAAAFGGEDLLPEELWEVIDRTSDFVAFRTEVMQRIAAECAGGGFSLEGDVLRGGLSLPA